MAGRRSRPGLLEEVPVLRYIGAPFGGYVELVKYSVHGTNRDAIGAVDACAWVDVILFFRVYGVDTINGANLDAGGVFYPSTRFSYYVGHTILFAES